METTGLFVKYHGNTLHFEIFPRNFLGPPYYLFGDVVGPSLARPRIISSDIFAFAMYYLINYLFNFGFD
jgi:hypothetical protein